jgi:hypothetical protein
LFIGCFDERSDIEKSLLDKSKLESILSTREDFNRFIESHFNNTIVISNADDELAYYLENYKSLSVRESQLLTKKLQANDFNLDALSYYGALISFLDQNFLYSKSDLHSIINERLQVLNTSLRTNIPFLFDFTCGVICGTEANNRYPPNEDGTIDTTSATHKAIWY